MEPAHNPYQAPTSDVLVPEPPRDLVQASRGRRFGTYVVDYFGYMLFSVVVGVVLNRSAEINENAYYAYARG